MMPSDSSIEIPTVKVEKLLKNPVQLLQSEFFQEKITIMRFASYLGTIHILRKYAGTFSGKGVRKWQLLLIFSIKNIVM